MYTLILILPLHTAEGQTGTFELRCGALYHPLVEISKYLADSFSNMNMEAKWYQTFWTLSNSGVFFPTLIRWKLFDMSISM